MTTSFTHYFLGVFFHHVSGAFFNQFPGAYMGNEYSRPDKHRQQTNEVLSCWTVVEKAVENVVYSVTWKLLMSKDDEDPARYKKESNNGSYVLTPDVALSVRLASSCAITQQNTFWCFPENLVKAFSNQRCKCHNMTWLHLPAKLMMR